MKGRRHWWAQGRWAQGWWAEAAWAVAVRPGLWPTAVAQAVRLARPGWWRRRPFLPLPDPEYLRFRLRTAYGAAGEPPPGDVVTYLRWCRDFPHRPFPGRRFPGNAAKIWSRSK